jgi:hypothetical protein
MKHPGTVNEICVPFPKNIEGTQISFTVTINR